MNLITRWYELVGLFRIWRDRLLRRRKIDPPALGKKDSQKVNVELNTADLEHLVFICAVARAYYEREYGLPMEHYWIKHADRYERLFNDLLAKADNPIK